jgi:hypothetical protein
MLKSLFREAGKPGAGDLQVMTLTSDLRPSNQVTNDRAPTTEQLKQSTRSQQWPKRGLCDSDGGERKRVEMEGEDGGAYGECW